MLALALGGLAAALPAEASAARSATSTPHGVTAASKVISPATLSGGSPPEGTAVPATAPVPTITDTLQPIDVTATDEILTCATSQTTINGTQAVTVPVGCLTLYNQEWVKVAWSGAGVTTVLTQQADGNLVLTPGTSTTTWASNTTHSGNSAGPGCLAQFQSSGTLVVSNCSNTSIWNSGVHSADANAVLAFQADGNIAIYQSSAGGTPLWSSGVPLNATSTLKNGDGGMCLAPKDNGAANPTVNADPVWMWSCTGLADENWTFHRVGTTDWFTITNGDGGKCLAPEDSGSETPAVNGDPVWMWTCTGLADETWRYVNGGTLVNGGGSKCLAPEDSGSWIPTVDADPVWLWTCTALSDETWS